MFKNACIVRPSLKNLGLLCSCLPTEIGPTQKIILPFCSSRFFFSKWWSNSCDGHYFQLIKKYHFSCRKIARSFDYKYCKPLYFRVFFISRFCKWKFICGNLNAQRITCSYVNAIYTNISRECWIHEQSNSQISAKIKFSRIIVHWQYSLFMRSICDPVYSSDVLKVSSDLKKKRGLTYLPTQSDINRRSTAKIFLRMAYKETDQNDQCFL